MQKKVKHFTYSRLTAYINVTGIDEAFWILIVTFQSFEHNTIVIIYTKKIYICRIMPASDELVHLHTVILAKRFFLEFVLLVPTVLG